MNDDFSEHPVSIAEIKADRANDAALWTPRDALIAALRAIDSGDWKPNHLLVVGATVEPEFTSNEYYNSIPSMMFGIGMLTTACFDFNAGNISKD